MERKLFAFLLRYGAVFRELYKEYPEFLDELRALGGDCSRQAGTTRVTRASDFFSLKETEKFRHQGTQTDPADILDLEGTPLAKQSREDSLSHGARPTTSGTKPQERESSRESRGNDIRARSESRKRRIRGLVRRANICWNCQSATHRYSECPKPKNIPFCYGCGRKEFTMRTCPQCGPEWRNLGPYHPNKGHLGMKIP